MSAPIAFILLAAGGSARMGVPKQFLPYRGRSLLRRAAEAALASPCRPVIIVIGAHAERARAELEGLPVLVAENPAWAQGVGSSIRAGLSAVESPDAAPAGAVVFGLCDQPHVDSSTFARLIDAYRAGGKGIVAAAYAGTAGAPVLFDRKYFPQLHHSSSPAGAKSLIARYADDVALVAAPEAEADVDTPEDYRRFEGRAG